VTHRYLVTPTGESGINTGRPRYRVECLSCGELLHEATTGAVENMEAHEWRALFDASPVLSRVVGVLDGLMQGRWGAVGSGDAEYLRKLIADVKQMAVKP
jgi:hypothetical protein